MWIALSARYPMAFDEGFHMGIVKIYSHQISPILTQQPPGPAPYGALTTDPSYLFHYLMSFPYRLLDSIFENKMLVIVILRALNVAFFAGGLILFRRLLLKTKATPGIVNLTMMFFVLVPVVPLLAGQINYDNLLMLIAPLNMLMALRFRDQYIKTKRPNLPLLLSTIGLGLLGSLVVFVYLPILTAITLYLFFVLWRLKPKKTSLFRLLAGSWRKTGRVVQVLLVGFFILSTGLFVQRYGVAIVRYHNLIPQCGQVLTVDQCQAYGPWARNYRLAHSKPVETSANPAYFAGGWLFGMFLRSFFSINGPGTVANYDNEPPPPGITIAAIAVFVFGAALTIRYWRQLYAKNPALLFMLFVGFVYVVSLIARNYHDYVQLGSLVAINGRYLVLIILPVMLVIGQAYQLFLPRKWQAIVLSVTFLLFLQGGGFLGFLYDSTPDWYRSDSQNIVDINTLAHKFVSHFTVNWPLHD